MADIINNSVPNPVMIYGRAPNGQLQAVTTDGNGNLSLAGGGATIVSSGLIGQCTLTETSGTTISCGAAGTGTFGAGSAAPGFPASTFGTNLAIDNFTNALLTSSGNWTI